MIYLIRHGQSEWNKRKWFNGQTDVKLTEQGINEAYQLMEKIEKLSITTCFCSPLTRAVQTGKIVYGEKMILDKRLREIDCGFFEGKKETLISMLAFLLFMQKGWLGIESYSHFMNRSFAFCEMLKKEYEGKNVLIITHAANARAIDYYFKGKPKQYDFRKSIGGKGEVCAYEN